jgi:lipopolysaccharide export system protein LptC
MPPDTLAPVPAAARARRRAGYNPHYSRFVGLAKRVLPGVALTLLVLIAIWPRLQTELQRRVNFVLPRLDPREALDLRMVSPRYAGIDRQNRPFVITAEVARQANNTDDLISLEGPKGDLTNENGSWLEMTSYTGLYQQQAQLLDLFGNVELFQDRGNEFRSDSAHIDVANGTAEGNEPVEGQGPFGHVTGEGFRIRDHGDVITFTGKSHLELLQGRKKDELK